MGENKSIIKIEEDCLHFFYQMARTHSPMWLRSLRSPPKSQVSQAWEKVLLRRWRNGLRPEFVQGLQVLRGRWKQQCPRGDDAQQLVVVVKKKKKLHHR
ncbi:unnamed protein product [Sphagnum jensenii]